VKGFSFPRANSGWHFRAIHSSLAKGLSSL
jgi:hypothetical protein